MRCQHHDTEATELNSDIISFTIFHMCFFTVACQNVSHERGYYYHQEWLHSTGIVCSRCAQFPLHFNLQNQKAQKLFMRVCGKKLSKHVIWFFMAKSIWKQLGLVLCLCYCSTAQCQVYIPHSHPQQYMFNKITFLCLLVCIEHLSLNEAQIFRYINDLKLQGLNTLLSAKTIMNIRFCIGCWSEQQHTTDGRVPQVLRVTHNTPLFFLFTIPSCNYYLFDQAHINLGIQPFTCPNNSHKRKK